MSKLSFRARALDASKPMPIYLAEELPDLPDYSAINRAVPQMPSGMEKEEESEHHLQRAISGTGLIIPTPEVGEVTDLEFYERCYPPDYKVPKQHIHMQPLWEEQEAPEYDIDSEDERWLKQQRHVELTEWKFEQMMDKLEKSSGQTVVTLNEAKLLLERHDEMVTAVYDYWLTKRLNTQHPLILSVKTESRPGQSSNNPYLAFRRRTEKMQTRKNRKNDESSYEKMLKLRRDLARALTLLELVARRETAKRELVKLTAQLAERRYVAGDFANQLLPDPPPRPAYTCVPIAPSSFRAYSAPHYPPRAPPTPVDLPRQREKRPYKRRKIRLPAVGTVPGLREAGVCSSSEEESSRTEAPPPDDGPFAFRRKPGCYYEMPTTTLCGDPLDSDRATQDAQFDHELDERNRFTLTSLNHPYPRCIGFARRRLGRGGRVLLDRVPSALDDLWARLPFSFPASTEYRRERDEEVELETKAHRTPKEMTRDYHTGGKHPWRHAFRQHLSKNPHLWIEPEVKTEIKQEFKEDDLEKVFESNLGQSVKDFEVKDELEQSVNSVNSARTIDSNVRENLQRVMRKRRWSGCSDTSYDSDECLQPVEKEFEKFITEVNKKWLHFRPKTPPPSPPSPAPPDSALPINPDTPLAVELRSHPSQGLGPFTTSEFTLEQLYGDLEERDVSGSSLDISGEDLLTDNFTGLTPDQLDSILSETDLKDLPDVDLTRPDKKLPSLLELVDEKEPFLCVGRGVGGRAGPGQRARPGPDERRGCTTLLVLPLAKETMYVEAEREPPKVIATPKVKEEKVETAQPVPTSKIIVEEVNEVPQLKVEKKRKEDTIEEVQLAHGVQLKTVQTVHSPLKKHIITSAAHRRASDVTLVTSQDAPPQILTVAVSDSLKVRLQNHLLSSQAGVLVQNGPFPPVAVAVPVAQARETNVHGVPVSSPGARRLPAPLVHLPPGHKPLQLQHLPHLPHAHHHRVPNKLKVLHAHPLTHTQRTQLLAQNRSIAQLPAVVSLSPLQDAKTTNTALLKAAPGGVTQFFEIKSGQLGKGPHLVNVVRQPQPGKTTVSRLELNDAKKRQVVAFEAGAALKGTAHRLSLSLDGRQLVRAALPTVRGPQLRHQESVFILHNLKITIILSDDADANGLRLIEQKGSKKRQVVAFEAGAALKGTAHRLSLSLDGRQLVRAALPTVRGPQLRHQIQLKNRTLQVSAPLARSATDPTSSMACIPSASKSASIPSSVVANLLQKNVTLPKGAQKIAISGPGGQPLSANVQAIAFTTHQLKARQPRHTPRPEIVEAASVPTASSSGMSAPLAEGTGPPPGAGPPSAPGAAPNGSVRRRPADTLPMEVT